MYKLKKIDVFLDISTFCNAGCPQCHRTNPDGLEKADWLPLINWSFERGGVVDVCGAPVG